MLKKIARKQRTVRIALRRCDLNWLHNGETITYRVIQAKTRQPRISRRQNRNMPLQSRRRITRHALLRQPQNQRRHARKRNP